MTTFSQLPIQQFIKDAVAELHFKELTPVQEQVIPDALNSENLIVQSQTGSGKTHSFLLPIINAINPELQEVQAVITAPSRELAEQLFQMAQQIISFSPQPINIVNYVGGTDKYRQIEKLQMAQPQIVVGTPGRIYDLMKENALWVQTTRTLVVDEADMTMDLGFLSLVDNIASRMPDNLNIMVFSATIPQTLEVFLNKYMIAPKVIEIEPKQVISELIDNYVIYTRGRKRADIAYELLTFGEPYLALVFCNTKKYANEISDHLKNKGLKVATLHGDITPRERKRVMRQIRDLEFQYVVATDLAARGIDIPGTSLVINMEVPPELEFFVHRVGRTGRNNIKGTAFTLITPDDDESIDQLEAKGIEFKTVDIANGEIKPAKSRNARQTRKQTKVMDDPEIKKIIGRGKKQKVKPGYKRKINQQIKQQRQKQARRKK